MTLRHNPRFVRFWLASSVSDAGTYVTTVALSVLILETMEGSAFDQGLVNAARWAPYLLFGLIAGIWVDGFERTTVLIVGDFGRGVLLTLLCVFGALGMLTVPALMAVIFAFGALALVSDAAHQSFLPLLVPRSQLTRANARLQQSTTVAETSGGALAGGLVALVTAPIALFIDACSYFFSGAVMLAMRREASSHSRLSPSGPSGGLSVRARVAEGLRWIYSHQHLRPLALSTHTWFLGFSMLGAVVPTLMLRDFGFGALGLGVVLSGAGVGAVTGTTASLRLGEHFGTGKTIIAARCVQPAGVALMALTALAFAGGNALVPEDSGSPADWPLDAWLAIAGVFAGQLVIGFGMGIEGPLQMGFEQAVTPQRLIARMSATRRSINRSMIVLGAPVGGLIAAEAGVTAALWTSTAIMLLACVILGSSEFRHARTEIHQLTDENDPVS